jgi:hypothetical protein
MGSRSLLGRFDSGRTVQLAVRVRRRAPRVAEPRDSRVSPKPSHSNQSWTDGTLGAAQNAAKVAITRPATPRSGSASPGPHAIY